MEAGEGQGEAHDAQKRCARGFLYELLRQNGRKGIQNEGAHGREREGNADAAVERRMILPLGSELGDGSLDASGTKGKAKG